MTSATSIQMVCFLLVVSATKVTASSNDNGDLPIPAEFLGNTASVGVFSSFDLMYRGCEAYNNTKDYEECEVCVDCFQWGCFASSPTKFADKCEEHACSDMVGCKRSVPPPPYLMLDDLEDNCKAIVDDSKKKECEQCVKCLEEDCFNILGFSGNGDEKKCEKDCTDIHHSCTKDIPSIPPNLGDVKKGCGIHGGYLDKDYCELCIKCFKDGCYDDEKTEKTREKCEYNLCQSPMSCTKYGIVSIAELLGLTAPQATTQNRFTSFDLMRRGCETLDDESENEECEVCVDCYQWGCFAAAPTKEQIKCDQNDCFERFGCKNSIPPAPYLTLKDHQYDCGVHVDDKEREECELCVKCLGKNCLKELGYNGDADKEKCEKDGCTYLHGCSNNFPDTQPRLEDVKKGCGIHTSFVEKEHCELCVKCLDKGCYDEEIDNQETCDKLFCGPLESCHGYGVVPFQEILAAPVLEDEFTPPPTLQPTPLPTFEPTPTRLPTTSPTPLVTLPPTRIPTVLPTTLPTPEASTLSPTLSPTDLPTKIPTVTLTNTPTAPVLEVEFTPPPTLQPTPLPMFEPTPTRLPTMSPTPLVTLPPTRIPTVTPTTPSPTFSPTDLPTKTPTVSPTNPPTASPTLTTTTRQTSSPTAAASLDNSSRLCNKCSRSQCFTVPLSGMERKCKRWDCAAIADECRGYDAESSEPSPTAEPSVSSLKAQGDGEILQSTGKVCAKDSQCESGTCRNGACMASSECFPIKHEPGTPFDENKVNIVFVGSGFDKATHDAWRAQVKVTYDAFKEYQMFARNVTQISVFAVDPARLSQSFCFYNCAGIDRLLCCDVERAQQLSSQCFPKGANLQTVVIHNDQKYGGAGYPESNIATMSTHQVSPLVAVHEIGHSLFELTDEYPYGPGDSSDPNCAGTSDCIKWSDLIGNTPKGYNDVECVRGCRNNNYFVGEVSFMHHLSNPVGAVNARYTCCAFLALTKSVPSYCDAFDFEENYLLQFCKNNDYQNFGHTNYELGPRQAIPVSVQLETESTKYLYLSKPMLVRINLKGNSGAVVLGKPLPGLPGLFHRKEVAGDFSNLKEAAARGVDSVLKVLIKHTSGKQVLFFSKNETIDVPPLPDSPQAKDDSVPLRVSEAVNVLNIAVDVKGWRIKKVRATTVKTSRKSQ